MLDVHTPLAGDISGGLVRYSFEAKLEQRLTFLEKWGGMAVSPLEVEVLERGLASFPCERPAAPYQETRKPVVSPVVGWAGLVLLHRLWGLVGLAGLVLTALILGRVRLRDGHRGIGAECGGLDGGGSAWSGFLRRKQ